MFALQIFVMKKFNDKFRHEIFARRWMHTSGVVGDEGHKGNGGEGGSSEGLELRGPTTGRHQMGLRRGGWELVGGLGAGKEGRREEA